MWSTPHRRRDPQLFNTGALDRHTADPGGGLARTKAYLSGLRLPVAEAALGRLLRCETSGDFMVDESGARRAEVPAPARQVVRERR
ncbi:hypothetical protein [Streptomyces sp. NPDC005799]|uniref:hypothetical protein n=1 Tax=Streptomyces sp. NPDC005799 TaxID=3154678 RepID=UPI0033CAD494